MNNKLIKQIKKLINVGYYFTNIHDYNLFIQIMNNKNIVVSNYDVILINIYYYSFAFEAIINNKKKIWQFTLFKQTLKEINKEDI